ncbi:MAG: FMN-binding protein [Devosia sp.]
MKKLALSLFVIAASAGYVWQQSVHSPDTDPLDAMQSEDTSFPDPSLSPAAAPVPAERRSSPGFQHLVLRLTSTASAQLVPAGMLLVAGTGYIDGTYTGPAVDAYYGTIQMQAVVKGGRLAGVKVVKYPSDRQTSVAINRQALPMLRDEVVAAQSGQVDIISGATLTSRAFIKSIEGALQQAH